MEKCPVCGTGLEGTPEVCPACRHSLVEPPRGLSKLASYLGDQWLSMLVGVGLVVVFGLWYSATDLLGSGIGEFVDTAGWMVVVFVGVLVAGAVMIVFGFVDLRKRSAILGDGQVTAAEVIHRYERTVGSGDEKSSERFLELVLPDGERGKLRVGRSVYHSSQKGDHIDVIYVPSVEDSVLINEGIPRYKGPLLMIGGTISMVSGTVAILLTSV